MPPEVVGIVPLDRHVSDEVLQLREAKLDARGDHLRHQGPYLWGMRAALSTRICVSHALQD